MYKENIISNVYINFLVRPVVHNFRLNAAKQKTCTEEIWKMLLLTPSSENAISLVVMSIQRLQYVLSN